MKTLSYSIQAIDGLKNIVKMQTETINTLSENIGLLREELTNLQKRTCDLNARLVEIEDWTDERRLVEDNCLSSIASQTDRFM
ncbi:hypothetical protein [Helicobacter cappadocius]|uniref:Uncharacterized protein n=1 Tax=Helicobacter cappadocius TaxID=3063998 RepID=A0AA90PU89_9HELI|nr:MULTISPECIES: hypothetical protein [unclassified Helicobacter]MDO7252782.1 hypothetical protein [Helicobacter sp. faydin-H75]MDP2538825.1 hypothetical protein [Helicobacter sp. faydin-H76]